MYLSSSRRMSYSRKSQFTTKPLILLLLVFGLLLLQVKTDDSDKVQKVGDVAEKVDNELAKPRQKAGDVGSKNLTSKTKAPPVTTVLPVVAPVQNANDLDITSINTGALKRAIIVTFGLCGLVMAYIAFKSFRVNKSRPQMVRKYGVLAHRQDVEMRPLPLDEDDEDDTTVFDAASISEQRLQP